MRRIATRTLYNLGEGLLAEVVDMDYEESCAIQVGDKELCTITPEQVLPLRDLLVFLVNHWSGLAEKDFARAQAEKTKTTPE